ncbi:hypothetical protein SBRCBS47491_001888 [Sporothrix bragantina]|uniref:Zinc finger PHD-type domain-containing protein n=1 Tax=Sporothrix bragantina TaxID=671064 RepID=A0ABP0B2C4_9PEZI
MEDAMEQPGQTTNGEPTLREAAPPPQPQTKPQINTPHYSRYTNQFSSASSKVILDRLRAQTATPPMEVDIERNTESQTMTMPKPVKEDNDSDGESLPSTDTKTGPVCSVCARPARSVLNPLVQCARCNKQWHRLCHKPVISDYIAATAGTVAAVTTSSREASVSSRMTNGAQTASVDDMTDGVNGVTVTNGETGQTSISSSSSSSSSSTPSAADAASDIASSGNWTCPPCTSAASAAAAARLAHRARTHNRPADALYVPPPPAPKTHNLTGQTPQQRRQYLQGLPHRELAQWLAHALETHPDLAVYPPKVRPPPSTTTTTAMSTTTKLPPLPGSGLPRPGGPRLTAAQVVAAARNPTYRNGIINSIRKSHAASVEREREKEREKEKEKAAMEAAGVVPPRRGRPPKVLSGDAVVQTAPLGAARSVVVDSRHIPSFVLTPVDPEEEDPTGLMANWPKPGQGLYANVGPDWDMGDGDDGEDENEGGDDSLTGAVLVDRNDHTSFSSVVYNAVGQKVQENGLPVLRVR